jgi:hypothetical protein
VRKRLRGLRGGPRSPEEQWWGGQMCGVGKSPVAEVPAIPEGYIPEASNSDHPLLGPSGGLRLHPWEAVATQVPGSIP